MGINLPKGKQGKKAIQAIMEERRITLKYEGIDWRIYTLE